MTDSQPFLFHRVEIFEGISLPETAHNRLAIWHGLPYIGHIKVNYNRWSAIQVGQISLIPKSTSTPP